MGAGWTTYCFGQRRRNGAGMAGNVNINVSSSAYCKACGATNPAQATHCLACREPLSALSGGTSATTNPLTGLLLPEVIVQQRYRILDVLSIGTVSTVYKAEDLQLGDRVVTLKEIGKNNQNTQEALASIEAGKREMLLLAAVNEFSKVHIGNEETLSECYTQLVVRMLRRREILKRAGTNFRRNCFHHRT